MLPLRYDSRLFCDFLANFPPPSEFRSSPMIQVLLSVPPRLRDFLHSSRGRALLERRFFEAAGGLLFAGTDPKSRRLGSGGGTVHLLHQAWLAEGRKRRVGGLFSWLAEGQKLVLNSGGESRRLPAYAAIGKVLMPIPMIDGMAPRRFDQTLADFQMPAYSQVLREAGPKAAVLVTAGDVWLDFNPLQIPAVSSDIVGIGMPAEPKVAGDFGVYFVAKSGRRTPRAGEAPIARFLQKPPADAIRRLAGTCNFYVDTGMWLLSAEALRLLFLRCGWDGRRGRFATADGHPEHLDLYTEIGAALGSETEPPARLRRLGWSRLRTGVIPLADAGFHHLGSTRQLFESFARIQRGLPSPMTALAAATPRTAFTPPARLPVWIDGVPDRPALRLEGLNAVSGLPAAARISRLARGWCVDVIPIGARAYVFRPYHVDDKLRGTPAAGGRICRRGARTWLASRGLAAPATDVFDLQVYPVIPAAEMTQVLLDWFFSADPDPKVGARVLGYRRLSAAQIPTRVNFARYFSQRSGAHSEILRADFEAWSARGDARVFSQDFAAIAAHCRHEAPALGRWLLRNRGPILSRIVRTEHASRFLLMLGELGGRRSASLHAAGRDRLQAALVASHQLPRARPRRILPEGGAVRARSPVRLDLAGGWTDTPPYCLEHGGAVLNVAVTLDGKPPIQVVVRPIPDLCLRLRSLDQGVAEEVATYARLGAFRDPRFSFGLAKAALALAGFHPDFFDGRPAASLRDQLRTLGGGLEVFLLSDVPKGSGLGTSSILAATLLGALDRACGLGWNELDVYRRVLGIEQLLTTGGGWQDQAGALFPGIKLVRTESGPSQTPTVLKLPSRLLESLIADSSLLLYYTGLTRLAKDILQEIVTDMALGRSATLRTLQLIGANALQLRPAIRDGDAPGFRRCIARSWNLNRRLDSGTSTPAIDRIIAACGSDLAACKLLGAGGGGYLLFCAHSPAAGRRIRARLKARPPNARAGFVDFQVSEKAMEVSAEAPPRDSLGD
jgi:galactokinase/mevalonate kinase-like predicted kinase